MKKMAKMFSWRFKVLQGKKMERKRKTTKIKKRREGGRNVTYKQLTVR